MKKFLRRSILTGLTGLMLFGGAGVSVRSAQEPNEPPPGTRADRIEDRQEVRHLRAQILADKERLRMDRLTFGPRSPQVIADRAQLRADRQRLRRLQRDRRLDRRIPETN